MKVLPKRFHLNGHTIGFGPENQKLELHTKKIVPCESTAEEVSFKWSHHRILSTDVKVRTTSQTPSSTLAVKGLKKGHICLMNTFYLSFSIYFYQKCTLGIQRHPYII